MQGGFQAYLRLSHFDEVTANENSPDFDPPFSDPLIDEVFFEFNLSTTAFSNRLSSVPQLLVGSGESGRVVVSMLARTHCAQGWTGQHCSIFCNSSTGIEICSRGEQLLACYLYASSLASGINTCTCMRAKYNHKTGPYLEGGGGGGGAYRGAVTLPKFEEKNKLPLKGVVQ